MTAADHAKTPKSRCGIPLPPAADHANTVREALDLWEAENRPVRAALDNTDDKGYSEETCVRCGWRMGSPPLNCQNDNTPHRFPSQEPEGTPANHANTVRQMLPSLEGHEDNCPCSVGKAHAALDALEAELKACDRLRELYDAAKEQLVASAEDRYLTAMTHLSEMAADRDRLQQILTTRTFSTTESGAKLIGELEADRDEWKERAEIAEAVIAQLGKNARAALAQAEHTP